MFLAIAFYKSKAQAISDPRNFQNYEAIVQFPGDHRGMNTRGEN